MAKSQSQNQPAEKSLSPSDKLEIMKMVHEHYRMDIEQIWKRGTVYLTISSALLAIILSNEFNVGKSKSLFIFLGVIVSFFWLVNSVLSHHWITIWREQFVLIDRDINPYRSFSRGEKKTGILSLVMRPQFYAMFFPAIFLIVWSYLAIFPDL